MQYQLKSFIFIIFGLNALLFVQCENIEGKQTGENIQALSKDWEKAVPHQEIPEGIASLNARYCGACHQKHYEEWRLSTHSHAWTDLQFQSELKKESSPFMCINCHIPLQNQQEYIIKGLIDGDIYQPVKEKNPHFDERLQQEGITCVACHLRNNAIIGPTGSENAPHKTVKDPDFLSEQLCISCHNANAVITPTLACTFQTGDEWKAGPYFGEKNCISCHMDTTTREIVHGYGKKLSHFHSFPGSGIPKLDTLETTMLVGMAFYPATLKKRYAVNEELTYSLKLKNEFAGHRLPTGDPERFYLISFELKNKKGEILGSKTERIGEEWQWHPVAKKLSDNNLDPGEERAFTFSHTIEKKEKLSLSVKVTKHRMTEETAEYNKLGVEYPLEILVFEEGYEVSVE